MAASTGDSSHSTSVLIARARGGDRDAQTELFGRYLAVLKHFAHGRIPQRLRGMYDTEDVVHEALVRALKRLEKFEPKREGSFLAYLKVIVNNMIKDLGRKASRTPYEGQLHDDIPGPSPDPLDEAVTHEDVELYGRALARLSPEQRQAVVHKIEKGWAYADIAGLIGCPTPNAARMVVHRGLARITSEMAAMKGRDDAGSDASPHGA